jgi:tetratricopeptide (TPR) repeat protein
VRHAAARLTEEFPDGQLYFDLANVPTELGSDSVALHHILNSLGTPQDRIPEATHERSAVYQSLLAGRGVLLVLENAPDARGVEQFIPATPGSAAIVTSRRQLASLEPDVSVRLGRLSVEAAVACLEDAATAGSHSPDELARLAELCGYFPLALKIAGALLSRGSVERVSDLIGMLTSGGGRIDVLAVDGMELRLVADRAYGLVSGGAQTLLRRLALLPHSSFAPWLATVALDGSGVNPTKALDELAGAHLIDRGSDGRLRMNDFVVDFARERFAAEDAEQKESVLVIESMVSEYASRARTCRRILEPERPPFGGSGGEDITTHQTSDSERWLNSEHENLVGVMTLAAQRGLFLQLIELANSLPTYFIIRGSWNDWEAGLRLAARAAESQGDLVALGYCLQALANIERTRGRGTGRRLIERSVECFTQARDSQGRAYVLNDLGLVKMYDGEWAEAIADLKESERMLRELSNAHLAFHPVRNQGVVYLETGDTIRAIPLLEQAADGFSGRGDRRWLAFTLGDLGKAYRLAAREDAARESLALSISLLQDLGEVRWAAATKIRLGDLLRVVGETTGALRLYGEALETLNSLGDPLWAARALAGMSLAEAWEGRITASVSQLKSALSTFRTFAYRADDCWALVCLHRILLDSDPSAAQEALHEAHAVAARMGYDASYVERLLQDAGPDVR